MRIQYLYNQGSSDHREDGLVVLDPFFGVIDATSAPFSPNNPAVLYNGLTGGEMVARRVEYFLCSALSSEKLTATMERANERLAGDMASLGLQGTTVDRLPGACFAFAKIGSDTIEIVQAGDCYAIWESHSGGIGLFRNQVRRHDTVMNAEIEEIMAMVAKKMKINLKSCHTGERNRVRKEMWNRFFPILSLARRKAINNPKSPYGYGFLNGYPEITRIWQGGTISRKAIKLLLLCTDGMIPWETARKFSDQRIARSLCQLFEDGGLTNILATARTVEKTSGKRSYIDFAEATAIAIQF